MENQEKQQQGGEAPKECDLASKPASSPIPAGYSNQAYPKCNTSTGTWEWYDPQIAP